MVTDTENWRLRRIVKENHGTGTTQLLFNSTHKNVLLAAAASQLSLYDDQNGSDAQHLDILAQFSAKDALIRHVCWFHSSDHDAILAVAYKDGRIALLSQAYSRQVGDIRCCSRASMDADGCPTSGDSSRTLLQVANLDPSSKTHLLALFPDRLALVDLKNDCIAWSLGLDGAVAASMVHACLL